MIKYNIYSIACSSKFNKLFILLCLLIYLPFSLSSQNHIDKCGHPDLERSNEALRILGDHWGYGYDDLLVDLSIWQSNEYIELSSIGKSNQNRELWQLKITDVTVEDDHKKVIFIHSRTHPNEVQAHWVTMEMIAFLLSTEAQIVRQNTIFYIIPMYNPDGVELEYPRQNANQVDIESNWGTENSEIEVLNLMNRFEDLMNSPNPVDLALNMHSAYACKRYFVYHDALGTSEFFAQREKVFIEGVREYYSEGIEPWNYYISWTNGTPNKYPESWWWHNFNEAVMALTYEDMNCDSAGNYEKSAHAIVNGIMDYLDIDISGVSESSSRMAFNLEQNYPNPVIKKKSPYTIISYYLAERDNIEIKIFDSNSQIVITKAEGMKQQGKHRLQIDVGSFVPGTYFYSLSGAHFVRTKKMIVF